MVNERSVESPPLVAWPTRFGSSARTNLLAEMGVDLLLVWASYVGAHLLRFGGVPPAAVLDQATYVLPVLGLLKVAVFYQFQLYRRLWTYAGTPEAVRLVQASTVASGGALLGLVVFPYTGPVPVALLVLDWLLTTLATSGWRLGRRALSRRRRAEEAGQRRIAICGADAYGVFLLRYLRRTAPAASIVGFVDPTRSGLQLRGLPVVETPAAIDAEELIVPVSQVPSEGVSPRDYERMADACAQLGMACHQFELTMSSSSPAPLPEKRDLQSVS